jgi:hypothetical protein
MKLKQFIRYSFLDCDPIEYTKWFVRMHDGFGALFVTPIAVDMVLGVGGIFLCYIISKIYPGVDLIVPFITGLIGLTGIYYITFLSLFLIIPIMKVILALIGGIINWIEYKNSNVIKLYPTGKKYVIPGSIFGFIPLKNLHKFSDNNPFIDKFNGDYFHHMVEIEEVDCGYVSFIQGDPLSKSKKDLDYYEDMVEYMERNGYNFHINDNRISMKIDDFCELYRFTGKYNYDLNKEMLNKS